MLGFEMEVNNKTKDDGSAESPTSVLEDEVCFVFLFFRFVWFSGLWGKVKARKEKGEQKKKKVKKK